MLKTHKQSNRETGT